MSDINGRLAALEKLARQQAGWQVPPPVAEPAPVVVAKPDTTASEIAAHARNFTKARSRQLEVLGDQWIKRLEWILKKDPDLAIAIGEHMRELIAGVFAPIRAEAEAELRADGVEWDDDEIA